MARMGRYGRRTQSTGINRGCRSRPTQLECGQRRLPSAESDGKCRACLALPEVPASDLPALIHSRRNAPCPVWPSAASVTSRCEPVPAFPLLPEPSACPAWPSAASVAARCEPIPTFLLQPGSSTCPVWPSATSASARCEPVPAFPLLPGPPTCPAKPSAAPVASRCEPVPVFPLLPGPSTCPAWSSAVSVSAGCEPIPANRLTPASRGSGSWPGTMAAGAQEQAASCDAFVLSRRLPAPGAPPSRTSPLCLIAKAPSNSHRTTAR